MTFRRQKWTAEAPAACNKNVPMDIDCVTWQRTLWGDRLQLEDWKKNHNSESMAKKACKIIRGCSSVMPHYNYRIFTGIADHQVGPRGTAEQRQKLQKIQVIRRSGRSRCTAALARRCVLHRVALPVEHSEATRQRQRLGCGRGDLDGSLRRKPRIAATTNGGAQARCTWEEFDDDDAAGGWWMWVEDMVNNGE
eukprot:Skav210964  [mRNA]  locus=scaffold2129:47385:54520:+ [translate_table: standard]